MTSLYANCRLCPRNCGVDRLSGEKGYCGETAVLRVAAASIHRGEEPPITGTGGSGTIFISGCNLGCAFCQNFQISQQGMGRALSTGEFAAICLRLQELGAENINIVTGSHAVPAIVAGLECARSQGMRIPVLWNSSGYDGDLSLLEGVIDGYLPDLKTLDPGLAAKFFNAPDYPEHAVAAILRMLELKGSRKNAVIIRHLVLPGHLEATREALRWFAEHCQGRALLSVMTQYTPLGAGAPQHYVNEREYDAVLAMLEEFGIEDGFYQELNPGDDWLPDFTRYNPFSSELSVPVWHWSREVPNHATTE